MGKHSAPEEASSHDDGTSGLGWPGTPAPDGGGLGWPADAVDTVSAVAEPARPVARRGWRRLLGLSRAA